MGSTDLDRIFLIISIIGLGFVVWNPRQIVDSVVSRQILFSLITGFTLLTWGAWAAVITLVLLSTLPYLIQLLFKNDDYPMKSHTRMYVALTIIPWAVWILWWTSLGQVNGLQTCIEGLCPHPRELDPGVVMVRGGYIGSRANPSTTWMGMMVVLPLVICSCAIMYQFCEQQISVKPYVLGQIILIIGCLNMYAFSPEFPRLIYNLTWNILFSAFQIGCAILALMVYRIRNRLPKLIVSEDWFVYDSDECQ